MATKSATDVTPINGYHARNTAHFKLTQQRRMERMLHHRPTEEMQNGVLMKEGRSFTIAIC
jgi:hypothetical protein